MLLLVWPLPPPKLVQASGQLLGQLQRRLLLHMWPPCWGQQDCLRMAQDAPATTGQL
jgi:hypothetical protein